MAHNREDKTLKYLRESKKLSIRNSARIIGLSDTKVNHAENGRCDLEPSLILKFLNAYGYSYNDFISLVNGNKSMPTNTYKECIEILKRLDKEKLRTVKTILQSF